MRQPCYSGVTSLELFRTSGRRRIGVCIHFRFSAGSALKSEPGYSCAQKKLARFFMWPLEWIQGSDMACRELLSPCRRRCNVSRILAASTAFSRAPFIFRILCLVTQLRCTAAVQVAPDDICPGQSTLHPASRRRISLSSCTVLHHGLRMQPKDVRKR